MKLILNLVIGFLICTIGAVAAIHFLVPNTRSGIHSLIINGHIEDIWAVYTDPASLPNWRASVITIEDLSGTPGQRKWTEVSRHNVRIDFRETTFEAPSRYALATASAGYFTGSYSAVFEQIEPGVVRGTFTETISTAGLGAKILAWLFVNPKTLIEEFARDAQSEVTRRARQN
jgi:hypothetical protein